jgi:twitching motility protein PilJ
MLPALAVGTAAFIGGQSLSRQMAVQRQIGNEQVAPKESSLQRQLPLLLTGTAGVAVVAGAIAAVLAHRALRPVLLAAAISERLANRLRRPEDVTPSANSDEVAAIESNLNLIASKLPDLAWRRESDAEQAKVFMDVTRRIRESLTEDAVLKTTVRALREALSADRVGILRFNANWIGVIIAESVAPGLPKALWAKIEDPCFAGGYTDAYRNGRVRAIDDIYNAGLNDCYVGLLERFAVKANVIAPIIRQNQRLFGLLVVHQCSEARVWEQSEIDLAAKIAGQVGYALDHASLLEELDAKAQRSQRFTDILRQIRASLNEADILKTTVDEVRKVLGSDRVIVYSFDADWYGTVVAESVIPGIPKALSAKIKDPCFAEGYVDQYRAGRVQATDNIYLAGLTDCHLQQLEPFEVKANLVAPIFKDDQLFGLLIAHECSNPRHWEPSEIDLFAQVAVQVGYALDHARLLERVDAEGSRVQMLANLTRRIRASVNEPDILKTVVEEVRKAIGSDRAIFYAFDEDWYGTVVAEAVAPGLPKALWAEIRDPCFAEGYVEKYQSGRVQATNDIYNAGLTDCHLKQLEPFQVKANLVAPILKDDQLFGLLIAHECMAPRDWQKPEIDLFAQVAIQVGFALDRARLLERVDRAYQSAELAAREQRQHKDTLMQQVAAAIGDSETAIQALSTETVRQLEAISTAYTRIQMVANSAQTLATAAQQADLQGQTAYREGGTTLEAATQIVANLSSLGESIRLASETANHLNRPAGRLSEVVRLVSSVAAQMKLQAMNASLEAARTGESGQTFASIAEKVHGLARQLETDITTLTPLVDEMQAETHSLAAALATGLEQMATGVQLSETNRAGVGQMASAGEQARQQLAEIARMATEQLQTATAANDLVLEVASLSRHTSEQSLAVSDAYSKLGETLQEFQRHDE